MALSDDFASAQQRVKTLSTRPSNDTLLELYAPVSYTHLTLPTN